VKYTEAERQFIREAEGYGWITHRNGWPDFLLRKRGTKKYVCVEVKNKSTEKLRIKQWEMLSCLKEATGMPIFVYWPKNGKIEEVRGPNQRKIRVRGKHLGTLLSLYG